MTAAEVQSDDVQPNGAQPDEVQPDEVQPDEVQPDDTGLTNDPTLRRPLYPRLLRLRHIHPNAWQRALLGEGAVALAALLVLADLATAWILLVLPVSVAVVVKAHDLLAGRLATDASPPPDA